MGILVRGEPLSWEETKALSDYIKEHGVNQFINLMRTMKQRKYEGLKWGDEIEYLLFKFDHQKKRVYLHRKTQVLMSIYQIIDIYIPKKDLIHCDISVLIFFDRLRSDTAILGKLYLKHFQTDTSLFFYDKKDDQ